MKGLFSSIYLVSRVASAALNLVAIAVFTRLSSREVYGEYLLGFAYGFIAYSLAIQWLLAAHFGQQTRKHAGRVANTVLVMAATSVGLSLIVIALATGLGLLRPSVGFGCAAILTGLAVYFVANEIGRAQLRVVPVTIASFLRSGLTLVFGSIALFLFHTAESLLLALSLAHIAAAVPIFVVLRKSIWADGFTMPLRQDYLGIWKYSWPLILAGGAGTGLITTVFRFSHKYGQHGLLKRNAKRSLPDYLKFRSRKPFIHLKITSPSPLGRDLGRGYGKY